MALTTKESVPSSPQAQEDAPAAQSAAPQATPRTDPIGIEVPVVVHASRYSAAKGLAKPLPPVHEETRTVIVFAQGAVVRLSASLSIGETVVLTNLQTGADVLCRVASVKAQPGIQNYIDLEFTQRAPGFWNKTSKIDAVTVPAAVIAPTAVLSPSVVPEVAPKPAPAMPAPVPPAPASTPLPPSAVESAPPVPKAVPEPAPKPASKPSSPEPPSIATLGAQPELVAQPPTATRPAVRTSSSVVAGASAGMRHGTNDQVVLGGGLDWTKESPARSKKGLIAAVAILAIGGAAGGAYLFSQRGHSAQPDSAITVTAPSAPVQMPQAQSNQGPAAAPAESEAAPAATTAPTATTDRESAPPAAAEKPADVPRATRREPPPADVVKPVAAPQRSANPPASLRPAVEVGNLKAPVLRNAAISGSSEPPPTLSAQDNSGTRDVLGSGVLSGAQGAQAPAPPVAFASPEPAKPEPVKSEPVKMGGQLQMPKAISSPPPAYPDIARAQGVQGVVIMDALIDATGTVADVKVTSGPPVLRQAAMDALRRWKYQPARLNGQPTSVHINVTINFSTH
jgi:protein TonB